MKILVNGGGNIGTTITELLLRYKTILGIKDIYLNKETSFPWRSKELELLQKKGVMISQNLEKIIPNINYIFEATENGKGLKNKELYSKYSNIKSCAQGSEKGFGIPFMTSLNNEMIKGQPFVQVVSCNTHGAASILQTFCNGNFDHINFADFVVVRRSEDLGHHKRLVTANVIARHLDEIKGTHHAIDVYDMLKTINVKLNITSSDITTPSQLMHSTRFHINLKKSITNSEILDRINKNPYVSTTNKFDSNLIFELGRRYGFQGRIFSHGIVVTNNLLITKNTIKGWAFIPQEGNTILSTIQAFILQTNPKKSNKIINKIESDLLENDW